MRQEDQQLLTLVGIHQPLAVELQLAQFRMPVAFEIVVVGDIHLVPPPDLRELGADRQQRVDDLAGCARRVGRVRRPDLRGEDPAAEGMVLGG